MKKQPTVTVICLSYNHEKFVAEAIKSVLQQTYPNIELIVVDDASEDDSQLIIKKKCLQHPEIQSIYLSENLGNCQAFNMAFKLSKGEYIIDLAADDILFRKRIEEGVNTFQRHDHTYGVNFTNAELISDKGSFIKNFYPIDKTGGALDIIPEGDVFVELIKRYFICPPTMMYRRQVLADLGGYDDSLSYEDFDFWIRSSRSFKYCYTDQVLVSKRILSNSKSANQSKFASTDTYSTYRVLKKAADLVNSKDEKRALKSRLLYESRKLIERGQLSFLPKYVSLYFNL
ncbi:MAG: glycosyltransferase [Bacteroidota bacterium]